jgi:hypothetical protein
MLNAWAVVQREQCFRRKDTLGHLHWVGAKYERREGPSAIANVGGIRAHL